MKWFNDSEINMVLFMFVAAIVLGGSAKADYNFGEPTVVLPDAVDPSISTDGSLKTELRFITKPAVTLPSQAIVTDGDWHRVRLVWDGSNRILYVDNVEVASDTYEAGLLMGDLLIGADSKLEEGTFWSGLIDDVRIYNRAITP